MISGDINDLGFAPFYTDGGCELTSHSFANIAIDEDSDPYDTLVPSYRNVMIKSIYVSDLREFKDFLERLNITEEYI